MHQIGGLKCCSCADCPLISLKLLYFKAKVDEFTNDLLLPLATTAILTLFAIHCQFFQRWNWIILSSPITQINFICLCLFCINFKSWKLYWKLFLISIGESLILGDFTNFLVSWTLSSNLDGSTFLRGFKMVIFQNPYTTS